MLSVLPSRDRPQRRGVLAGYRRARTSRNCHRLLFAERYFFDCTLVHLLTTATLDRLWELYPQGHFEIWRFRPNIVVVVEVAEGEKDFVENAWIGQTLAIGDTVRLKRH